MFVILGNRFMKEGDYEGAIKLFKRAHLQPFSQTRPHLKTISLVSDPTLLWSKLILFERYLDGSSMDLLSPSEDNYAKHCLPWAG